MPDSTRGSIYISTANEIGEALVEKLGGSGYTPNEWDKSINLCGISDADIPTALENIEESADGTERGSFAITKANAIASVLNKKFKTTRGFKPKEWASAVDKLTALQVKNASGAIASFKDGADDVPIASASFSIVPYQNLNGYSKPWASGCGNNKLNPEKTSAVSGAYGLTVTFNNGTVNIKGTSTSSGSSVYFNILSYEDFSLSNLGYFVQLFNGRGTGTFKSIYGFRTANEKTIAIGFDFSQNQNIDYTFEVSVSPVNLSSYEPYSNVCPITPYSQMTITKSGVNLWNGGVESGWIDNNGADSPNADCCRSSYISIVGGLSYYFVCGGFSWRIYFYDRSYNFISYIGTYTANRTITAPNNACYLRFALITTEPSGVSVNYPPTKTDAILPKNIQIIVDSFGRSVYGGSRASDGTLTETHKMFTLTGSSTENYYGSGNRVVFSSLHSQTAPNIDNNSIIAGCVCSHFPQVTNNGTYIGSLGFSVSASEQYTYIYFSDGSGNMTAEAFKSWLQNNTIKIVLKVKTPTTYALEPLPEIDSYYGDNNIYTDIVGGESSVNYRADIDLSQ